MSPPTSGNPTVPLPIEQSNDCWETKGTTWISHQKRYKTEHDHPSTDATGGPDLQLLEGKRVADKLDDGTNYNIEHSWQEGDERAYGLDHYTMVRTHHLLQGRLLPPSLRACHDGPEQATATSTLAEGSCAGGTGTTQPDALALPHLVQDLPTGKRQRQLQLDRRPSLQAD